MYLSIPHLPIYLSISLSVCLSSETSSGFELDNIKNGAILRDFLNVWTWQRQKRSNPARLLHFQSWQHQKRSNSARIPQFLNLTTSKTKKSARLRHFSKLITSKTSKTKQFCEASFKNGKLRAVLTASYQSVLRFFQSICLNYCALPRKSDARSYEVLHLSLKMTSANLKISGSKMRPFSGNQRPDLLTALMNMSLVLHLLRKMHLCRSSSNVPRLPSFLEMLRTFCSLLTRCTIPCACHAKRHLNVQKLREHVVFFIFWVRNVLRATTACTFSTSQRPKVVREWCALYILTSTCASR